MLTTLLGRIFAGGELAIITLFSVALPLSMIAALYGLGRACKRHMERVIKTEIGPY